MRDYAKVSPKFWIGPTGKSIRKLGPEIQVLAFYLMTSPHANMLGIYHLPIAYIVADTGITFEGASKGLASLSEAGFCGYDEDSEVVFIYEMARYQIGEQLKPNDNQVEGVRREYRNLPENRFLTEFYEKYSTAFHLGEQRGLEGACKALRSQEQEKEQEQEIKTTVISDKPEDDLLACPIEKLVEAYHELLPNNPRCKILNNARRAAIRQRWREAASLPAKPFGYSTQQDGLEAWRKFFAVCAESDFLTGKVPGRNGAPPFVADVDFLFSPRGFAKVLENKYHREAA